jgi:DNA-binding transcriptional regulator GbsR (MarR family)
MRHEVVDDAASRFIEQMGLIAQGHNLPRISGRILGLLVLEGRPFGLRELAERLQVSRASVSTNARLLSELGVIHRIAKPGDRQDYYELGTDPYARLLKGVSRRMSAAHEVIREADASIGALDDETHRRLQELASFYKAAADSLGNLVERFITTHRE